MLAAVAVLAALLAIGSPVGAQSDQSVYEAGRFEIGDGVNPPVPGMADVEGNLLQDGPDWSDLFDALRSSKDIYDEFGQPGSNGVPDYMDTWGEFRVRRDAVFVVDDLSSAQAPDSSALLPDGRLGEGVIDPAHDVVNAYAYATFSPNLDLLIYGGIERRTATGPSEVVFEFNQNRFTLNGAGGVDGERTDGDLRVHAFFETAGLSAVEISRWDSAAGGYQSLTTVGGEDCNLAGTACTVCNAASVDGGAWPNFDENGGEVLDLAPGTLMEFGISVGALTNDPNSRDVRFYTLQISTPQDFALGHFERAHFRNR